jgi:hypothetical protein
MADEHNLPAADWRAEVDRYAALGEEQAEYVRLARGQVLAYQNAAEYWEAVYTLAHQRAQMADAHGGDG